MRCSHSAFSKGGTDEMYTSAVDKSVNNEKCTSRYEAGQLHQGDSSIRKSTITLCCGSQQYDETCIIDYNLKTCLLQCSR
jgi:hypothetical protein